MQYRIFRACSDARNACFGGPQKGFDGIGSTAVIRWKDRLDLLSGRSGHSGGQPERPEVRRRANNADVQRDCLKGTKLEMLSWRLPAVHRIVHQTNLSRIVLGDRCLDPILPSHES